MLIETVKSWWKEYKFMLMHPDPNSYEGLIHRAEKIEREYGKENNYAKALRKLAGIKLQEEVKERKR